MAISSNTKKNYSTYSNAYKENDDTKNKRSSLLALSKNSPTYNNSYANQLSEIYKKIKNQADFNYDAANDAAYSQWAEQANALSGLAISGNQQQAQNLTGGYGSSYAPEVANQGLTQAEKNVKNAQPYFMLAAEDIYANESDRLADTYKAAADARDSELDEYNNAADAYNTMYSSLANQYNDASSNAYNQYNDTRNYWATQYANEQSQANTEKEYQLKVYDTYNTLAATKCAKYNKSKNNSGMKAYLNGLVKAGKITQYMADNLYDQYKYIASASGGSSGGSSGSGSSGGSSGSGSSGSTASTTSSGSSSGTKTQTAISKYGFTEAQLKAVGLNKNTSASTLDALIDNGTIVYNSKMNTLTKKQTNVFQSVRSSVTGEPITGFYKSKLSK